MEWPDFFKYRPKRMDIYIYNYIIYIYIYIYIYVGIGTSNEIEVPWPAWPLMIRFSITNGHNWGDYSAITTFSDAPMWTHAAHCSPPAR